MAEIARLVRLQQQPTNLIKWSVKYSCLVFTLHRVPAADDFANLQVSRIGKGRVLFDCDCHGTWILTVPRVCAMRIGFLRPLQRHIKVCNEQKEELQEVQCVM